MSRRHRRTFAERPQRAAIDRAYDLLDRGRRHFYKSQFAKADAAFARALALFDAECDVEGQARVLYARGELRTLQSLPDAAELDFEASLALFVALDDDRRADVLLNRGELRARCRRFTGALADYGAALELYRAHDDKIGEGNVLCYRSDLLRRLSRLDEAEADLDAAIAMHEEVECRHNLVNDYENRATLRVEQDRLDDAEADYAEAWRLCGGLDYPLGEANVLLGRGRIACKRGAWQDALIDLLAARDRYVEIGDSLGLASAESELARTYDALGEPQRAVEAALRTIEPGAASCNRHALGVAGEVVREHIELVELDDTLKLWRAMVC